MVPSDRDVFECLKENWQHARHVENERLMFTQFYTMIVGAVVTILVQWSDRGPILVCTLMTFVLMLSILGLLLAQKWGQTFDKHMARGRLAAERLGVSDYMVIPGEYSGLAGLLRTRYLFCYFYATVIAVALGVISYSLSKLTAVSVGVAMVSAISISVITCRDPLIKRRIGSSSLDQAAR